MTTRAPCCHWGGPGQRIDTSAGVVAAKHRVDLREWDIVLGRPP
jgi:hypothetical protein